VATLALRGISKHFGQTVAVDDVTIDVADGEFLVLVGPSGCGKSTTLRVLAGLEKATAGRVLVGGVDVTDRAAKDRNLAMVFQSYALYPHMTVAETIGFALRLQGLAKAEIAKAVQAVAEQLEIAHLLRRKPRELSGGQRQRVAVARCIVRRPEAFLFDEPLSNLDAKLRASARVEIAKLQKELGVTSVYVTHDQVEAMTMADRIVLMDAGRIRQVGPPMALYREPADLFVAGFLGAPAMNIIHGVVRDNGAGRRFQAGVLDIAAPSRLGEGPAALGIRPEALMLSPEPGSVVIDGVVSHSEQLGAETITEIHAETIGPTRLTLRLAGDRPRPLSGAVSLHAPSTALHFFAEDGRRIQTETP